MAQPKKRDKESSVPSIGEILGREVAAGRVPPQNLEAETSLLGSILIEKDAIIKVADVVSAEDFYVDRHALIYSAIMDLYEQRQPIDIVSLSNKLAEAGELERIGGSAYVADLTSAVPTAAHVVHYAGIVSHKATLRRLIAAASNITQFGYDEQTPLDQLLDKSEQTIFEVSQKNLKQNFIPIQSILSDSFDRLNEMHSNADKLRGIPTGFKDLDRMLAGLQNSDLIIIAARPSMGKTTLVMNIAHHVATTEGVPVGFFSLEVSKEQLIDQLLAIESGIDSWKLRTGALDEDDFPRINDAMAELSEAPLYIDDSAMTNVMEMRTKARRLQAEHGLGLIIIDYLQLISGSARSQEGRQQEVSEISRGLKGLARELGVPVIALSQLSRAVESRNPPIPQLSDLRDSGCLTGDTLVYLPDTGKYVPIKQLVGKSGIGVSTINTDTWKIDTAYISKAFSTGIKPVFRITTTTGRTLRATANHKFLTSGGWKRLDELAIGEHLAQPRILAGPTYSTMDLPKLALLGHLIGDGCTLPRHAIQYTTREPDIAATVMELATTAFPGELTPSLKQERTWYQVYLASTRRLTHGVHNPITNWLMSMSVFGLRSHEKFVPEAVFGQSREGIGTFLSHLWATDGCIFLPENPRRPPAIYYASSSKQLARDVQSLLLRLGINSRLSNHPQIGKGRDQYHVTISSKPDILLFNARIGAVGSRRKLELQRIIQRLAISTSNPNRDVIPRMVWQSLIRPAIESLGMTSRGFALALGTQYNGTAIYRSNLSRDRAERIAVTVESQALLDLAQSDVYWDKITSITPAGTEEVFDLTVPGPHNFVAADLIVHNSIEQDADVVAFIYRPWYYDKQADENTTEILIKKHRNGPIGDVELYFHPEKRRFTDLERFHG